MKQTLATIAAASLLGFAVAQEKAKEPDNSGKNERDKSGATVTPGDQSNTPEDLKRTQAIRRAVMEDKSLTMTAKNVKIITIDGKVTLRGPVQSAAEKEAIVNHATAIAGKPSVTDELEVKTTK